MKDFKEEIRHIERELGESPRDFGFFKKLTLLRLNKPDWNWREDEIKTTVEHWNRVLKTGKLGWGIIIQVNELLFERGRVNCPGEMLVCTSPNLDTEFMTRLVNTLFDLKGNSKHLTNKEEYYIANYLENELIRVYGLKVPKSIANLEDCFISTVFFQRKHIPGKAIVNPFFPILYSDTDPKVVIPVPHQYWTEEFKTWWFDY